MSSNYITNTIKQLPNCNDNSMNVGRIKRRFLTTFIPPSTKSPIFKYGADEDQRSFLSLISSRRCRNYGYLHVDSEVDHENDSDHVDINNRSSAENASVHSLPADMDEIESDPELQEYLLAAQSSTHSSSSSLSNDGTLKPGLAPEQYYKPYHTRHTSMSSLTRMIPSRQNSGISMFSRQSNTFLEEDTSDEEDFAHETVTMKSELAIFIKNVIPLMITFCLTQSYAVICTIFASKYFGKTELSAVSLGSMTATITLSIFEGISTSLDTLCPQAYGSGNMKNVGLYTQRATFLSLFLFVPFGLLWWNSRFLFMLIIPNNNDPNHDRLVDLTVSYLRVMILAAPAYILFENFKRFLQCQGIYNASTFVLLISTPLSILEIKLLADNFGFIGIPITCVLNFWTMCSLLILYIKFVDGSYCWVPISKRSFENFSEIVKFAFAGVVCNFLENLSWEVLTIFASFLGVNQLAAQSAITTVASLTFFVPFSVGIVCSTRVANFIGANRIDGPAQLNTKIGLYAAFVVGVLNCCVLWFGRNIIANVYSNDPEVIELIIKVLPWVAVIQIFDSLNTVSGSLLRGQGSPFIGGVINFVVYDFFALPLALFLGYHMKLDLVGLWIGIGFGLMLIGLSEAIFVFRVDWEKAVRNCMDRNSK